MSAPIDFYFDFASPYGYFAATRIDDIAARYGREVIWRPVLLGAIFKVTGMKPNLLQPLRGDYLKHDVVRFGRLLGVPLIVPEVMPLNALIASRAYWWLYEGDAGQAKQFARAIYHAHWGEGRDVTSVEAVAAVAEAFGIAAGELAEGVQKVEVKDRLRREIDRAIERGVFGSPFIIVDDEPFWGADRLDQIESWLERGGW
jgi:2-hydroxychromene-2-carboxylate isomerase